MSLGGDDEVSDNEEEYPGPKIHSEWISAFRV